MSLYAHMWILATGHTCGGAEKTEASMPSASVLGPAAAGEDPPFVSPL